MLFSLLSNSAVSYILIPFDMFESAQAAHVEGIQSIAITDGQVPCLSTTRKKKKRKTEAEMYGLCQPRHKSHRNDTR